MARRARTLWRQLEDESGEELLLECGMAWFAHRDAAWEAASERTLAAQGIPVERLDIASATDLYPSFRGDDLAFVLLEPEGGVLRAERSMRTLAAQAVSHGARIVRGRASPDGAAAVLEDSTRLEGDVVVWACGPWLPKLFPDLVSLKVTQQELLFVDGGPAWRARGVPAWCDYERSRYGTAGYRRRRRQGGDRRRRATARSRRRPSKHDENRSRRARLPARPFSGARGSAPHRSALVSGTRSRLTPVSLGHRIPNTRASGLSVEDPATGSSTARQWPSAWRPRSPREPRCRPTSRLANGRALRVFARPALVTQAEVQRALAKPALVPTRGRRRARGFRNAP